MERLDNLISDQEREIEFWKRKADKYKQAFQTTEERVNQIIDENDKLNRLLSERGNAAQVQDQTIKDYEEKLGIMIHENNKLNDIIQQKLVEESEYAQRDEHTKQLVEDLKWKIHELLAQNQ